MFWWTWSLRRRMMVLALLAAPLLTAVLMLAAPRLGGGDKTASPASSTTVTVETTIVAAPITSVPTDGTGNPQILTSPVRVGVKLTPTAFELLPETLKPTTTGQSTDIVLPGAQENDRSVYVLHNTKDWESLTQFYVDHFKSKGLTVSQRTAVEYAELQVTGAEGQRRFRAVLRVIAFGETAIVTGLVSFLDPL